MACISQHELDDIQLLMHLDGIAGQPVKDHLTQCAHCRARAERLRLDEARLASALYRRTCPSSQELGEYHLGVLARRRAVQIKRHLAECPHCAREVAQLQNFLADLAPEPKPDLLAGTVERIRVRVARWVAGAAGALSAPQPAFAPALAGVRGEDAGPAVYEVEGVQVLLAVQRNEAAAVSYDLLGLLTGAGPAGFTANLFHDDTLFAAPVDEGGNFTLHDLAPGDYELLLGGPDEDIYIEKFRI